MGSAISFQEEHAGLLQGPKPHPEIRSLPFSHLCLLSPALTPAQLHTVPWPRSSLCFYLLGITGRGQKEMNFQLGE